MNITLLFLLLIMLFSIVWHIIFIKNEKQYHDLIIHDIEEKIEFEIIKKKNILSKSNKNPIKIIDLNFSIIKQQIDLLTVISNQNEY